MGGSYESNNHHLHVPQDYTLPKKEPTYNGTNSSGSDEEFNESVMEQQEKIDDILESHDEILDLHMKILKVSFFRS